MITLALDAASGAGTIAVFDGDRLAAEAEVPMGARSGDRFFPSVLDALREAGTRASLVSRVCCGAGPGSFTSLRIVGAIAKGIAEGARASLHAMPSLALAVAADPLLPAGRYLVLSDALRGECFAQMCERTADGRVLVTRPAERLTPDALSTLAAGTGARLVGFTQADALVPHARGALALERGGALSIVDVAAWEPVYGRLAEAQVKWEAAHGRPLPAA